MKTIILTILGLALLSSLCDAQTVPKTTTPVTFTQQEVGQITANLQRIYQISHRLDISALKRDSLDALLIPVIQYIDEKNKVALKADTAKTKPVPKPGK